MVPRISPPADSERQRMWNTMRQLKRWDTADLEATADVSKNHAQRFVMALVEVQYVVLVTPAGRGRNGPRAIYRLVRNTGPVAPRITEQGILDNNLVSPYSLPPHKRVTKHGHAFLKALRELVDAVSQGPNSKALRAALQQGRDVLHAYEEDA